LQLLASKNVKQLLRKLKEVLGRIGIRKWLGPDAAIEVEYVSGIRDWKSWPLISKNKLISRF